MCTGAFLLAATGLLDGKTCSTHWSAERKLKQLFPKIRLQPDKVLTVEKGIYIMGGLFIFALSAVFSRDLF